MFTKRPSKTIGSFVLCLLLTRASLGQDTTNTLGNVSIASPTAASLGKFGDIPVSYHTGIPNISIPIYTVQSGSLKLPIGLSYHAGGLKVQEPSGWVGAGWALNAGGVITRTVVGAPDDRGNNAGASITLKGYYSDLGFQSYLNANGTSTPDDIAFARGYKDGEPDLFFYNFGGFTGKFYFNDDRTPILLPEGDLNIQPQLTLGPGFTGFIITTQDGTKYYFGATGNHGSITPVEVTTGATTQNGYSTANNATSSWFLNKIVSADGMDSILLSYQTENYSYYTLSTVPVSNAATYDPNSSIYTQVGYNVVKNFVSGVRLSQINFPNGQVSFNPTSSPRQDLSGGSSVTTTFNDLTNSNAFALDNIAISGGGFCKTWQFNYDYFYDNSALSGPFLSYYNAYNLHTDQYRLKLTSVSEQACDMKAQIPPYTFTYFTESVPRRLSLGIDHWGYPNGRSNMTLVPTFTVFNSQGTATAYNGADRDAYWPAMRGGSMQRVTYPTGGNTTFEFEPKAIYSWGNGVLQSTILSDMEVHLFGQGNYTASGSFTIADNGYAMVIQVPTYTSSHLGTLNIYNSSNALVYTINVVNTSPIYPNLPPGSYTATLNLYNGDPGGIDVQITQLQWIGTTVTKMVGGLRIKAITHNDGLTGAPQVISYSYLDNASTSNDILYSMPTYVQVIRNDNLETVWPYCSSGGCSSCDGLGGHTYFISAGSLRPMATAQGENVGYNEVDVTQTGNGHSVYRYFGTTINHLPTQDVCNRIVYQNSLCDVNIPNYPAPPVPFDPLRDELSYEGHFSEAGQLLKEVYTSPTYTTSSLVTPGHMSVNYPGIYSYTEYTLQTQRKTQDQLVQTIYDPAHSTHLTTTRTTYYSSPWHHQPTRVVSTTSTGDTLVSNVTYAVDLRISSCDATPDGLGTYNSAMQSNLSYLNSNVNSCSPQVNSSSNCRWTVFTNYRELNMQARQQFISFRRQYFANDSSNTVSTCYLSAQSSADALLKPVLVLQSRFMNPVIETSDWKNANLRHAGFTGYSLATNPSGFPYPAKSRLINLQAMSPTFSPAAISGTTLTNDSRYLDETAVSYASGRVQQVTPHTGVTTSYIWDYANQLPVAKVSNATADQIAYTSFEADGRGGWSPASNGADPGGITGSYSYGFSRGAISKSGLNTASTYIVSYWTSTGSSQSVTGTTAVTQGKTIGSWTYFEHTVTGVSSITISGTGNIDELRLYPAAAQMTSYVYDPLLGMTAQCDVGGLGSYYSYDPIGRLTYIKDQDGNVVKRNCYNYNGLSTSCQLSAAQPVSASNTSNRSIQIAFINATTGNKVHFTIPAGASNMTIGALAPGTYDVTMKADNSSNTYPVVYTFNGNTQKYFDQVVFSAQTVSSPVTVSVAPPPYYALTATNSTNQVMTLSVTDVSTNGNWTFTVPAGTSNQVIGSVPNSTYNVTIAPGSPLNTYPVVFNFGAFNQTYYALVAFGNVSITAPVSVSTSPVPQVPVFSTNQTTQTMTWRFTNIWGGVLPDMTVTSGTNGYTGYVPQGTYTVLMSPSNPTPSYPILYTVPGNSQNYHGAVVFGGVTASGTLYLAAAPPPNESIVASNNTTHTVTLTFTNTSTGYQYPGMTVPIGASNSTVGTLPAGTYSVLMSPASPNSSQPILWEIGGYNQTYYGPVGFSNIIINSTCTVNCIRQY